jgi:hypothetical protein
VHYTAQVAKKNQVTLSNMFSTIGAWAVIKVPL